MGRNGLSHDSWGHLRRLGSFETHFFALWASIRPLELFEVTLCIFRWPSVCFWLSHDSWGCLKKFFKASTWLLGLFEAIFAVFIDSKAVFWPLIWLPGPIYSNFYILWSFRRSLSLFEAILADFQGFSGHFLHFRLLWRQILVCSADSEPLFVLQSVFGPFLLAPSAFLAPWSLSCCPQGRLSLYDEPETLLGHQKPTKVDFHLRFILIRAQWVRKGEHFDS